jgi:hypothetical protein
MPFRQIPHTETGYALIAFDKDGRERTDDTAGGRNGLITARILEDVKTNSPTNIFLFSHGWKGDMPAAIDQYDRWIKALTDRTADIERMKTANPGFNPLFIGLHWPSLPWGDDELAPAGFAAGETPTVPLGTLKNKYLERLGDTPQIRGALDVIFKEANENAAAMELSPEVVAAYHQLNDALGLNEGDGVAAPPDADREPFDPEESFQIAQAESSAGFGGFDWGGILSPLRQLSFWTMKKRARTVGESGMHDFIAALQRALPNTGIHLMGHSFGCIVVSSILRGKEQAALPRPVDSTVLVQGALSLWAYCTDIPKAKGHPGFYHAIVSGKAVRGPLVTTRSKFDTAVGKFYPIAAGLVGQVDFDTSDEQELPKYGGVGSFGIRGLRAGVVQGTLEDAAHEYGFEAGTIYNLEGSGFIRKGDGASGAHNDIDGPEVAHAIWQAAAV